MRIKENYILLLLLSGIILFFTHIGLLYVDIMEARNFLSARDMVENGNWIFTTMNNLPRYEKPPMPTWFSAIFGWLFSTQNIWALRIPAALFSILNVIFLYKITKIFTDKKLAFTAAILFSTSFLIIYVGRRANWDIYSYSFATIGLYYFILGLKDVSVLKNYLISGLFFGLSFLCKGPTGHYTIVLPFFIAYIISFGFPKFKNLKYILICVFVTLLIGLSWYAYIYLYDSDEFMKIIYKEFMARGNRDVKPFTRYFSFPVQAGVWAVFSIFGLAYKYIKNRTEFKNEYKMFFWWTAFVFLFLSLVPSKKERYLYPMFIPLAVTTAFYISYINESFKLLKWEKIVNKVAYFLISLIGFSIIGLVLYKTKFNIWSILLVIVLAGISFLIMIYSYKNNFKNAFFSVLIMMHSVVLFGLPKLDEMFFNNKNYKSLESAKFFINKTNKKLYSYKVYEPEVWFRYGENIPEIDLKNKIPKENEFYIITFPKLDNYKIDSLQTEKYKVKYISHYDDNEESTQSKNNTDRKRNFLYLIKKM